jgi:hypothetical protein
VNNSNPIRRLGEAGVEILEELGVGFGEEVGGWWTKAWDNSKPIRGRDPERVGICDLSSRLRI